MVVVTVRDVDRTIEIVTAVTEAGANIIAGPDLRMSDPEKAANSAYGAAYRAARARAEAYAEAADMEISRVLSIHDAGGSQDNRHLPGAVPVAPPPPVNAAYPRPEQQVMASGGVVMAGQTTGAVAVQVDFALVPQ